MTAESWPFVPGTHRRAEPSSVQVLNGVIEKLLVEVDRLDCRCRRLERESHDPDYVRADVHEELVRLAQRVARAGSVIPLPKDKVQRESLEKLSDELHELSSWLSAHDPDAETAF